MVEVPTRMVIALGVAWILDGLEITIASYVGPDLTQKARRRRSAANGSSSYTRPG